MCRVEENHNPKLFGRGLLLVQLSMMLLAKGSVLISCTAGGGSVLNVIGV